MLKKVITPLKKIILLLIIGLILSSCQRTIYVTLSAVSELGNTLSKKSAEKKAKAEKKKDALNAFRNKKYKEEVREAINDIVKRPINKEVQFAGVTLLIPENTRINSKYGNIVDEKTGYGISLRFEITDYCTKISYRKKVGDSRYLTIFYNGEDPELNSINIIEEKIVKTNGFTKTCK